MRNIVLLAALCLPVSAAIPAAAEWEVRPTVGSNTNGGCYVAGSAGTDYSQQTSPQYSFTDLATTATATVVSSASHNFVTADVGNCLYITGGSFTTGWYSILSVSTNQATLSSAPGAASITGGTWNEGGALANLQVALTNATAANRIWEKATGTEANSTTTTAGNTSNGTWAPTTPPTRVSGYTTTRGDGGMATLQATAASIAVLTVSGYAYQIDHFTIDCNSQATSTGVNINTGTASQFRYSLVKNCTLKAANISTGGNALLSDEFTGNSGAEAIDLFWTTGYQGTVAYSWIHDNTTVGLVANASNVTIIGNVFSNNTGSTSDGMQISGPSMTVLNNTVYASGRNGIYCNAATFANQLIKRNLIVNSGGWGFVGATVTGRFADPNWDGNAFYGNTSGTREYLDDTTTNPQSGAPAYTNTLDVTLTASPFLAAGTNNYALNTTAGGGAAAVNVSIPMPASLPSTGYTSFGAIGPQTSSASISSVPSGTTSY